jgi:WD40 repeat protein
VPGADPLGALTDAKARADRLVLIVDQLEELFAAGVDPAVAQTFCTTIAEHATVDTPVILTIRADHLTALAAAPELGRIAERGMHFVTPLTGDELREAIEGPARQAGLRVEHGLVDLLIRDAEGEPGALPLLSHALVETWRRRDGYVLTVEGYQASGGIRGAVARSADRLYDSLPEEQRLLLRSLMLRLVSPSLEGDPVRCRVPTSALRGDPARERIVAALVRARLVIAETDTVEIAHEALAKAWPRLRAWLDDDTAGQRVLRHLSAAAEGWESLGRPDSELYRGARLEAALEYRRTANPDLTTVEGEFLDEAQRHAQSEVEALAARAQRDARQNRRLRALLVSAAVLLVGALVAGLLAWRGRSDARVQRDVARAAEEVARASEEDAEIESLVNRSLALRSSDRDVAALLAVEAARRWPDDARTRSALFGTFTAAGGFLGNRYIEGANYLSGDLVPNSTTAIVGIDGTRLVAIDIDSGQRDERFPAPPDGTGYSVVKVSADGRYVAQLLFVERDRPCGDLTTMVEDDDEGCAALMVYDVASGEAVLGPLTPPVGPGDVAISDDGSVVAVAGGYDGKVAVYAAHDGEEIGSLPGVPRPDEAVQNLSTAAVAFGRDGQLYVGSLAGPIRVVDVRTLEVTATLDAPPFSSHNALVVTGDHVVAAGDQELVAFDAAGGDRLWSADIRGTHPLPCPWFAASAAADRVYCGNLFGVITERELATGARTGVTLDPQLGSVGSLSITADGRDLVAFGDGVGAISRWRLDGGGAITELVAPGHVNYGWNPSGGGEMPVVRRPPGASSFEELTDYALWDPLADRELDALDVGTTGPGAGWVSDDLLAFVSDTNVKYYDVSTRRLFDAPSVSSQAKYPIGYAAAQSTYYTGEDLRSLVAVDTVTGEVIGPTIHLDGEPAWTSATRGGDRVVVTAVGGPDGDLTTVHDGETGEQIGPSLPGAQVSNVTLDGELFVATGGDIARYDLATMERVADLPGARGFVNTLQLSDDGAILLATSLDQTASVYDVASGIRLGDPIRSDAPWIYGAGLRPDGGAVGVTVTNGVAVWDLDPARMLAAACRLAGRNLTGSEWRTYLAALGDYRPTCPAFV